MNYSITFTAMDATGQEDTTVFLCRFWEIGPKVNELLKHPHFAALIVEPLGVKDKEGQNGV